ncbi:MAG: DNA mismatch repair endonuclease MutL [Tepidisphaeraceae bacterium]
MSVLSERKPIRQLPPNLVNRIAAGEVIERPASVVKECVENALDAGTTSVVVEIEDGGKQLIRITDNGSGIPPDELPLAFASHATSKLRTDEDLFAIATMGFRGEALASIGSVSFASITTRTRDGVGGFRIENRGGDLSPVTAAPGNVGTVIEVRDLFFNVPARRKFLKGSGTESGHVADAILKIALARPEASFRLVSANRVTLDLPATDERTRWLAAWPDGFEGQCFPIDVREPGVRIRGLIGLPELAMPHLKHQQLFVNGRCVRDKFIGHALKEAYRGLTEPGRNPAAILMIELPPDQVDVNVHPTKSEVRFRDSSRIHGLVMAGVREILLAHDLVPRATVRSGDDVSSFAPASTSAFDAPRDSMREQLAAFFRSGATSAPSAPSTPTFRESGPSSGSSYSSYASYAKPQAASAEYGGQYLPSLPSVPSAIDRPISEPPTSTFQPPSPTNVSVPIPTVPAIQLHNSYLVVESEDGLLIIDQHALHERILFEHLLQRLQRGPLEAQHMLIPLTVKASPQQVEALDRIKPVTDTLGLDLRAIGPEAVAIHAFPSFLERLDPAEFVRDLLARAEQEDARIDHETLLHNVLDMMSCKAAVKAGDPLTPEEVKALLEQRHLVSRTSNCPHGRPTTLRLTLKDLEKQFKRTGF